jgi:putative two-component system response regulator
MYARTPRPCLEYAILVAESHHERYDGTGYPNGLAGDDIPLCARMMAVMDTFDALINTRAYRGAMGHVDALRIVCAGAGTLFDPRIIEAFQSVRAELADIIQESRAGNRVQ